MLTRSRFGRVRLQGANQSWSALALAWCQAVPLLGATPSDVCDRRDTIMCVFVLSDLRAAGCLHGATSCPR